MVTGCPPVVVRTGDRKNPAGDDMSSGIMQGESEYKI